MIQLLWAGRHSGLRQALILGLLGAALVVFTASCSGLSEPMSETLIASIITSGDVPAEFTVRTDTVEGMILLYRAQGVIFAPIPSGIFTLVAETHCQLYAVDKYGLFPKQGRSAGFMGLSGPNPRATLRFACVFDKTYSRDALDVAAGEMEPPRVVIHYDSTLRTVRFGPARVD